jgi:hypothetical protein
VTALIALCAGIDPRPGTSEYAVDPASINWRSLRGKPVRIVYEEETPAVRDLLRAACANDCRVELLDVGMGDLVDVFYDDSAQRKAKAQLGLPIHEPYFLHSPWLAWADLREYRRQKEVA